MRTNTAYDLYTFEREEPRVKVVKAPAKAKKKVNLRFVCVVYFVALIALMALTVYNRTVLIENTAKLNSLTSQVTELENKYLAMNVELERGVSLKDAENYAVNELGLVKMDSSQIIYVNLHSENFIERGPAPAGIGETAKSVFGLVTDYFGG